MRVIITWLAPYTYIDGSEDGIIGVGKEGLEG